jgi:hypothetical protein
MQYRTGCYLWFTFQNTNRIACSHSRAHRIGQTQTAAVHSEWLQQIALNVIGVSLSAHARDHLAEQGETRHERLGRGSNFDVFGCSSISFTSSATPRSS